MSTIASSLAPCPNSGGSGWCGSKQRQIESDSQMMVPSSSSSAGTCWIGLIAVYSGDLCAIWPRSTCSIGTDRPFSARKIFTRRGFGALPPSKSFIAYSLLTTFLVIRLTLFLRFCRILGGLFLSVAWLSGVSVPEASEIPMPSEKPLAKRRRLAAQRVRDARERLTSTTGTRVAFDYELLRQFAENRLSASLVVLLLVGTVGVLSGLWTGAVIAGAWTASVLVIHAVI